MSRPDAGPARPDRGRMGRVPYVAAGSGAPLVVLAGLSPGAGADGIGPMLRWMAPFTAVRRVLCTNRRPGLPRGMTMAEMAAEHADGMRAAFGAPVDVLGLSTGGSIAQQLAADHPDCVRRLVLASTACRLGPEGRSLQRRVAARVRRGAHRRALAVLAADLVGPGPAELPAALAAWLLAPRLDAGGLADMATTIEAEDGFDLARCARPIAAPTLIVAGARDRFYGRDLFEETARLIPAGRLLLLEDRGHVTALTDRRCTAQALAFLDDAAP